MRRPSALRAAVAVGAALSVAVPGVAGASTGPAPGSPAYLARDAQNIADAYGRQTAPDGQLTPAYGLANAQHIGPAYEAQLLAQAATPTRPALTPGLAVPGWNSGNPYRQSWNGRRGHITPVRFTGRYGELLRGDVFTPMAGTHDPYTGAPLTGPFPGVVITTGSVQGSEQMYWWLAEDLAERGYVVLTYDVQGQGTSETFPHQGPQADFPTCDPTAKPAPGEQTGCPGVPFQQSSNFIYGTRDALTFMLSTPKRRYPNPSAGSASVNAFNPLWGRIDRRRDRHTATPGRTTRVGIIGHSLGAAAVSFVQGVDSRVETAVALDKLSASGSFVQDQSVTPKVPALGVQSEYGFNVEPYWTMGASSMSPSPHSPQQGPDPKREESTGFTAWRKAGVDSMVIVPRASTHLEYTDINYALPASRYGQDVASYYVQAWLDRYLKHDPGAERRLLATRFGYLEPVGQGRWAPVGLRR